MKKINIKTIVLYFVLTMFSVATICAAQDTKDDIKSRMKERFAKISELKKSGKIGETPFGFAEAVNKASAQDNEVTTLIAAENNDRRQLYALIAKESQTSIEEVGMANAKRYFQKASDSDYFKTQTGGMEAEKGYDALKTLNPRALLSAYEKKFEGGLVVQVVLKIRCRKCARKET